MIKGAGYTKTSDFWALGILIFDMLTGEPPFRSNNDNILYKKILTEKIRIPNYLTGQANSIIRELLTKDEKVRLGHNGVNRIKQHSWFKNMNWIFRWGIIPFEGKANK